MTGISIPTGYPAFNLIQRIKREIGQVFSGRLGSEDWNFVKGIERLNLIYHKEIQLNYTIDAVAKKEKGIILITLN